MRKYRIDEDAVFKYFDNVRGKYGRILNQKEKGELIGLSQTVISRLSTREKSFGELKADQFLRLTNAIGIHPVEAFKIKENES